MKKRLLLLTPPFTQLNTPYPATAYLKGFANTLGIPARQADLGIEVILRLFSEAGLRAVFQQMDEADLSVSDNTYRIFALRDDYLRTIGPVVRFLQHRDPTLAFQISTRRYLPEASRFAQIDDLEWAFGSMGIQDRARHLATLYLEDLGDLLTEAIDPHFGFSRYAERLGRTATHFDEIRAALLAPETLVTSILQELLLEKMAAWQPDAVGISVPFPGNLFGALKCGQIIKRHFPAVKTALGGGYANTELRRLSDERLFDFVDFVCLDDGEAPLQFLLEHLDNQRDSRHLKRTFSRQNGTVVFQNGAPEKDIAQRETGTPDYTDLPLADYLSVIEIANPMHRLWSDGRWNKLTLAHGCYWGKCSFCDITLDYIKNYEPLTAAMLCDRIETLIRQTGQTGFHFVDEAAPPALMRDLALEIVRRGLTVSWWTNIRFEKSFTPDLCRLLRASGCIAVSGGLEVASDRLLAKMKKGVTVAQVARVAEAFTAADIMVHAYLMYGFPTQTAQETIDSLEMVRQLFQIGAVQSGFWHQFAMTAHSPVGLAPADFGVENIGPEFGGFADNDLFHHDPTGAEHEQFSDGLKKSLFNFMHGVGFELPLAEWFEFPVPATTVAEDYIEKAVADGQSELEALLAESLGDRQSPSAARRKMVVWLGKIPEVAHFAQKRKGKAAQMAELTFYQQKGEAGFVCDAPTATWLDAIFPRLCVGAHEPMTFQQLQTSFEQAGLGDFRAFLSSRAWGVLREEGLLLV